MILRKHAGHPASKQKTAFLLAAGGGTGSGAIPAMRRRHEHDGAPFSFTIVHVETDRRDLSPLADVCLPIGLTPGDVEGMLADPAAYGPVCETMVKHHRVFLDADSIQNGARTFRMITQLAMERHLAEIETKFHKAVRDLVKQTACQRIVPVFFGSSGGGTGSTVTVVLTALFADPDFKSRITEGMNADPLGKPVLVLAEPYAYALKNKDHQANKILANMLATRIELAQLAQEQAFQYCLHLGMANDGGAMLDTEAEICKQLGLNVYSLCRNWDYLKARFVDTVDGNRHNLRYGGYDVPERVLPPELHPHYASTNIRRPLRTRISVCRHPISNPLPPRSQDGQP